MAGSPTELIKEKLDIVEFLRGYLTLQAAGKNFKALCPFHREKTPSFMVSPDRQSWHCFGCALGGDIFAFLMRYENVEFGEALRILADKAGVELRRLNPAEYKFTGLLHEINEVATQFFKKEFERAKLARQYAEERGLKAETIEEFDLGWAPNESESLSLHLLNSGYNPSDVLQAGLSFKTDRGLMIDRFRGRIMFPIHNHFGKVVGFTGRVLPKFDTGEMGKYVNSPETPLFSKSKILYGFWKSKNAIRESGSAFLVEGQMDFLMSWQAGVKNAVASSGTALTLDHLRVLRRLTDQLIVSFDADEAGIHAGERAIELAEANDFGVKVAMFEKFKDPAEAAHADPENLRRVVLEAKPAMEFYFEKYLPKKGFKMGDREHLRSLRAILMRIRNISSPVEQSHWVKELARRTGVEEKALSEESARLTETRGPVREEKTETVSVSEEPKSRRELISQKLLSMALRESGFELVEESIAYLSHPYGEIFTILKLGERKSGNSLFDQILNLVILRSGDSLEESLVDLKEELFKEYLREKRENLIQAVRQAERAGNEAELQAALLELNSLSSVLS